MERVLQVTIVLPPHDGGKDRLAYQGEDVLHQGADGGIATADV